MDEGGISSDGRGSARAFYAAYRAHVGPRWWRAFALVGAGAVIEGFGILLLVPIVGLITGARSFAGVAWLGGWSPGAGAALLLALFVAVMALRGAILFARDTLLAELGVGFVAATRTRLMRRLAGAPWQRVAMLQHSAVTNLMSGEIDRISVTTHVGVQGAVAAAMLAIQAAVALLLAPAITLAVGAGAAIVLLARRVRGASARDLGGAAVASSEALVGVAANLLGGLKSAIAEGTGGRFVDAFAAANDRLRGAHLAFVAQQARARLVFNLLAAVAAAGVLGAGLASGMPAERLIALVVVFARMIGPATALQQAVRSVAFGLPAHDAVRSVEARLGAAPAAVDRVLPPGPIVLDRASFVHPDGGGLHDATLTIAPGEFLGITGPSGAGKSTLVDLVAGLLSPASGHVTVGGAPLTHGWGGALAYVGQDGFLLHDSVRANLAWGEAVSDEQLHAVLQIAGAERLVAGMAQGLATIVGERGARLSGGERQRLAIARALLREPRLLILDEATSALDLVSEAALLGRIAALRPRPTVLLVAHRRESLHHCDRVITIDAGRIAAL